MTDKPVKTYKREVAVAILSVYVGLLLYSVYDPSASHAADQLKVPTFAFVTMAFGADVLKKQV